MLNDSVWEIKIILSRSVMFFQAAHVSVQQCRISLSLQSFLLDSVSLIIFTKRYHGFISFFLPFSTFCELLYFSVDTSQSLATLIFQLFSPYFCSTSIWWQRWVVGGVILLTHSALNTVNNETTESQARTWCLNIQTFLSAAGVWSAWSLWEC